MIAHRRLAGALALGLLLVSGASALADDKVKFGMLRVPNALLIGIEKGYFADEGIDVEPVFLRSGAEVASQLASGNIDIGATTAGATLYNAMARGVPVKIVADYIVYTEKPAVNSVVVRKDLFDSGEITRPKDLKGRTIAITARGQVTHLFAGKALELGGHSPDDARLVTMSFPDMLAAFGGGAIDAAAFVEPLTTVAAERGLAVKLIDAFDMMPNMNLAVIMYGDRLIEEDRDLGQRFMNAFHRANATKRALWATDAGKKEVAEIYQKYVPRRDGSIYERVPQPMGRESLVVNVRGQNGLADQLAWYVSQGLVPDAPSLDEVVDNSFAEKAAEMTN